MINGIPPAGTEVLGRDNRGRPLLTFAKSWYDLLLDLVRRVEAIGNGGGTPGAFTFTQSDVVLGRSSPGGGEGEELTFTDKIQQLADDTTFEEMRNTLEIDAENTPYTPDVPGDWGTVPTQVAEALDYLVANAAVFDPNTILTDGDSVLVGGGHVLTS